MKRYATIDVIRGIALFGVAFVHIFSDLADIENLLNNINQVPLLILILMIALMYFGSWGGMFVMISATGNMFSIQANLERGKKVKNVMIKQIVGGIILLIAALLVEGTFQYYGFFGSIVDGVPDWTHIIWHAYAMAPPTCLAICMIFNGLIHGLLSINDGYLKIKRNIVVYIVLSIVVLILTQFVWDAVRSYMLSIGVAGYPNAYQTYVPDLPSDYHVFMPPMDSTFWEFILYFLFDVLAGSNTPIFPFLIASFVGNIIALTLIQKNKSPSIPKKGMLIGLLVIVVGAIIGLILGAGFDEFLPISNNYEDLTAFSGGVRGLWIPWFCFTTGGQIVMIYFILRLVEFRGKGTNFAKKTTFFRRFGVPAFSVYSFHRFWAMVPYFIIGLIPSLSLTFRGGNFSIGVTLLIMIPTFAFIHFLLVLWEKVGYFLSIEWGIGTVTALILPQGMQHKKNVGNAEEVAWYRRGLINVKPFFYDPEWISVFNEEQLQNQLIQQKDSKLAYKLSILAIFFSPIAILSIVIAKNAKKTEKQNPYNRRAWIISIIMCIILVVIAVVLSLLSFDLLNISLF